MACYETIYFSELSAFEKWYAVLWQLQSESEWTELNPDSFRCRSLIPNFTEREWIFLKMKYARRWTWSLHNTFMPCSCVSVSTASCDPAGNWGALPWGLAESWPPLWCAELAASGLHGLLMAFLLQAGACLNRQHHNRTHTMLCDTDSWNIMCTNSNTDLRLTDKSVPTFWLNLRLTD